MISRDAHSTLLRLSKQFKVVGVIGPRQSGKTTLVREIFKDKTYLNLENLDMRQFALEDPRGFMAQYSEGAILDEAQRVPGLFSYLQQHVDERKETAQFILTGSNNFLLQENIAQSLAGRIAYISLLPFSLAELKPSSEIAVDEVLFKGMYPPIYDQKVEPNLWYANYIRTYIERDVRQIKNITDLMAFERFVRLCAGRVGQLLNVHNLAIESGIDSKTVQSWLGILESSFVLFRLPPYYKSFNKRLTKMNKLYFYDSGLACALLGINKQEQLFSHPLRGALFENLCISEMIKYKTNNAEHHPFYFWRDHVGNEIDVIYEEGTQLIPIEIKSGQTISQDYYKGLNYWQKISGDAQGIIVYGGDIERRGSDGKSIISWRNIHQEIDSLKKNQAI